MWTPGNFCSGSAPGWACSPCKKLQAGRPTTSKDKAPYEETGEDQGFVAFARTPKQPRKEARCSQSLNFLFKESLNLLQSSRRVFRGVITWKPCHKPLPLFSEFEKRPPPLEQCVAAICDDAQSIKYTSCRFIVEENTKREIVSH
jgi:hypothetical protein